MTLEQLLKAQTDEEAQTIVLRWLAWLMDEVANNATVAVVRSVNGNPGLIVFTSDGGEINIQEDING